MEEHLRALEAESIYIMREVVAESDNPVMLYSIGKDSSVMLHLALKAFYPELPPFPFLHVDTTWKFKEMITFRDRIMEKNGLNLIVHRNEAAIEEGINPFDHGSRYTDRLKTDALKEAIDLYGFTACFGGARRDEEKSRAKERILSFRNEHHAWDPKNQRSEFWNLYNTHVEKGRGEVRVFPLSNWTELDIWKYIKSENIEVVPLYFAKERPIVKRSGNLILVDDDRLRLKQDEVVQNRRVRFRTLGCYPLTGGIESHAESVSDIIDELMHTQHSERTSRVIDYQGESSMEKRKKEGYF